MDTILSFSISSSFYKQSGIIEAGWEILRDFTNILFIFSLLMIAFKMVLGQDDSNNKSNLIKTIILALVINFSLFISYAIIDGSNILAHVFYNRIDADVTNFEQNLDSDGIQNDGDVDDGGINLASWFSEAGVTKSPSLAIAAQINPQRIINTADVNNFLTAFIIVTGMAIMNILLIYLFFSVTLIFLGRILGLLLLVILSPIAFASLAIPMLRKQKYVGWDSWFSEILKLSLTAPIFLFFLWLTVSFVSNKGVLATLAKSGPETSWLISIINTYILLFLIGGILYLAKKITTDMAGSLGNLAGKTVGAAVGGTIAAGALVATGGLAAGGLVTSGVGRTMTGVGKIFNKEGLVSAGRKTRTVGRMAMSTKLDPTKIPGFSSVAGTSATKAISSVTSKSALGHIDGTKSFEESEKKRGKTEKKWQDRSDAFDNLKDVYKEKGGVAAAMAGAKEVSGYNKAKTWQEKIEKEQEKSILEKAKEKAEKARAEVEAPLEKPLQEAKQKEVTEQQKFNSPEIQKELKTINNSITDSRDAENKVKTELAEKLLQQKKIGEKEPMSKIPSMNIGINKRNAERKVLANEITGKQAEMKSIADVIEKKIEEREELSKDLSSAKKDVKEAEAEKKNVGDLAENSSRAQTAKKLTDKDNSPKNQKIANKIIQNKGLKTAEEKVIEKLIKESEKKEKPETKKDDSEK